MSATVETRCRLWRRRESDILRNKYQSPYVCLSGKPVYGLYQGCRGTKQQQGNTVFPEYTHDEKQQHRRIYDAHHARQPCFLQERSGNRQCQISAQYMHIQPRRRHILVADFIRAGEHTAQWLRRNLSGATQAERFRHKGMD